MKKIIIVAMMAIVAVCFGWSRPVKADEGSIKAVFSPKIGTDKLVVFPIAENPKFIMGKFDVSNQEDKNYYDNYYKVSLYNVVAEKAASGEENLAVLYDPSNWILVTEYVSPDPVAVNAGKSQPVVFSLDLPVNLPSGDYILTATISQKEGIDSGPTISEPFKLKGNDNFVFAKDLAVTKQGKKYGAGTGIDFSGTDNAMLSMTIQSESKDSVNVYDKLKIFDRNQLGTIVAKSAKDSSVSLSGGESKEYTVNIPAISKPGSYLAELQLFDEGSNLPISGPQFFRVVIQGEGGRITELSTQKTVLEKNESVDVSLSVVGSADSVILNEAGNWKDNPSRQGVSANLEVSILDSQTKKILGAKKEAVILGSDPKNISTSVSASQKVDGFILKAVLSKGENILDEKEVVVAGSGVAIKTNQAEKSSPKTFLFVAIIVIILIIIFIYLLKRKRSAANLVIFMAVLSLGFLFSSGKASAWSLIFSSMNPNGTQHYNYSGMVSDIVPFSVQIAVDPCTNTINSVDAGIWIINGVSCGGGGNSVTNSSGYTTASTSHPIPDLVAGCGTSLKLGSNAVQYSAHVYDLNNAQVWVAGPTNNFYIDSGKVAVSVKNSSGADVGSASVHCSSGVDASTDILGTPAQIYRVLPGTQTCTATSGSLNGSTTFNMDQVSKAITITLGAPSCSAPTCSFSFNPTSVASGGTVSATWSSTNDADGQIPYTCRLSNNNVCETNTLTTPSGTSNSFNCTGGTSQGLDITCTGTATNSCGTSVTCSGILDVVPASLPPVGGVETGGSCSAGSIHLWGWALDQNYLSTSIPVQFYEGGVYKGQCATNTLRSDINTQFGSTGNHGFDCYLSGFSAGNHTITVFGVTVPGSTFQLPWGTNPQTVNCPATPVNGACGTAARTFLATDTSWGSYTACSAGTGALPTFPATGSSAGWTCTGSNGGTNASCSATRSAANQQPSGNFDSISCDGSGNINVQGWAYDPDVSSTSILVHVYEGATYKGQCATNVFRSDVNSAYGITGNHGYNCSIGGFSAGSHTIIMYAIDSAGGINPLIGSRTTSCAAAAVNGACGTAQRTFLATDTSWGSYTACSAGTGALPTFPAQGSSAGWTCTGLNGGTNASCSATRSAPANQQPSGNFDSISCDGLGNINVQGWAYDPDVSSTSIPVQAYEGAVYKGQCATDVFRSDVNTAYGITGNHGYNCNLSGFSGGDHTIIMYAIDSAGGINPLIGSRVATCAVTYSWQIDPTWGTCTGTCGTTGNQTRNVVCINSSGTVVADSNCSLPKPATSQTCPMPACTYSWVSTGWTACSGTCGTGTQTRTYSCLRSDPLAVPDTDCISNIGAKPVVTQSCALAPCDKNWKEVNP